MRKIIVTGAGLAVLALTATACSQAPSVSEKEQLAQQADTRSLDTNQPIPHYNFSQIRQTLIDAENISAQGTQTTTFFFQMGDPDPVFTCPSIGMPVANTAQLSNPDQITGVPSNWGGGSATIGQEDPNGIYAPSSSQGTYVICVNNGGQKYLQYWEGDVMSVTAAATWDTGSHSVHVTGAPTYRLRVGG